MWKKRKLLVYEFEYCFDNRSNLQHNIIMLFSKIITIINVIEETMKNKSKQKQKNEQIEIYIWTNKI